MRRAVVACFCLLALTASLSAGVGGEAARAAGPAPRPNILLLVSDDQAWSDFSRALMPSVYTDIVDQGVLFHRAYVNTSLCCPSRAQMLTGLVEHHTGVDANAVPLDRPTIVQALHDVGYRTMLAGKYLNSWESCDPRPEFDRWACVGTPAPSSYSLADPYINEDGTWTQFDGYQTDVLADQVAEFIQGTPKDQPFFAMYTPTTPHMPADDPRYDAMPVTPPRPPSFDQDTMRLSSPLYARRGPLTPDDVAAADGRFTKMSHAVRSLDDGVGTVLNALGDRSRDTLVIYLSDNGFLFGEHRRFGKTDAYEESVRVPMIVRYPALVPTNGGFTSRALVSNVDLAPTFASLAGISWHADGRSLVPILDRSARSVRSALLLEHCQGASQGTTPCSGLSFFAGETRAAGFVGVVTSRYKYVRYVNGDVELFDLRRDPNELRNLIGTADTGAVVDPLRAALASLLKPSIDTTIATGPWPAAAGASRVAAFTYFSPSRFSTYRCRLTRDGVAAAWHSCNGQFDAIGGLTDGKYMFEVAGTDQFGQTDPTPAARSFTVSASGPEVSIATHPPAAQMNGDASFRFSSPVPGATLECKMAVVTGPPVDWAPCDAATGANYTDLADGAWSFEVRAQDPVSHAWSEPPAGWLVKIDRQGPTFATAEAPPPATSSRNATLRVVPGEAIAGPVSCRLDGRAAADCSSGVFTATRLKNGAHIVRIVATDTLGNVGETDVDWVVDVGPPKVRIRVRPDPFTTDSVVRFRFWSKTDPSLFLCSFDGLPEAPCDDANDIGPLLDGSHRLIVWGLDAAMNRSTPISSRFTVDTIPPGLILTGTPEDGAITANRTATFGVWQSEPGDLLCSLDDGEFASCPSPVEYQGLGDGAHTFKVYVRDRAGNVSIEVSRSWTVDPNATTP
jgi:arylsulfatase A-like enzyme